MENEHDALPSGAEPCTDGAAAAYGLPANQRGVHLQNYSRTVHMSPKLLTTGGGSGIPELE